MTEAEIMQCLNGHCDNCKVKQQLDLEVKRLDNEMLENKSSITELEQIVKNTSIWAIGILLSGVGYLLYWIFENVLAKKGV